MIRDRLGDGGSGHRMIATLADGPDAPGGTKNGKDPLRCLGANGPVVADQAAVQ
jgi:hypothetical protein